MEPPFRLTPTMTSRKVAALSFIERYWLAWKKSPSLQEVGNALGVSRQTARDYVRQLAAEGDVFVRRGPGGRGRRGIVPVTERDRALRLLRDFGYTVDQDVHRLRQPILDVIDVDLTNAPLSSPPTLDDAPDCEAEDRAHDDGGC